MSVAKHLERRRKQRLQMLRADIDQRGMDAAIEYAKNRLNQLPKHGALDSFRELLLNASLNLGTLTELQLEELLKQPQRHDEIRGWLGENLDHSNPVIRVVAAKVLKGELVSSQRSGPKSKADAAYQFVAWQIASDLKEIGIAMHHGGLTAGYKLTAAEIIAKAAGVSISLARDWIAAGQQLAVE
jgi:hypothetical protein